MTKRTQLENRLNDDLTMIHTTEVMEIVENYAEQQAILEDEMISLQAAIVRSKRKLDEDIVAMLSEEFPNVFSYIKGDTTLSDFIIKISKNRKDTPLSKTEKE